MENMKKSGFTLVELLTVVAIIGILASMVFTVGPRMIEKSKVASLMNTCNQIRTACVAYATKSKTGTFPPMYGYKILGSSGYSLAPYVSYIKMFKNMGIYDPFSQDTHDTDADSRIGFLEFSPIGDKSGPDTYTFPTDLYTGSNLAAEVTKQLSEQRPLVYIPVNSEQAKLVATYYDKMAQDPSRAEDAWYATRWLPAEAMAGGNPLAKLRFPPTKYDDFVLISVGPNGNTGGILTPPQSFLDDIAALPPDQQTNIYHILALRAFFLATRDRDGNQKPDFDYRVRKRGSDNATLPDGSMKYGPIIYRQSASQ